MATPDMPSPSERYLAAKERTRDRGTDFADFTSGLSFELDPFQNTACRAVQAGRGVLVAAPTGAGKTIVGEFAVYLALQRGHKAFYTTPIKALSNQKYQELAAKYGTSNVGLLTGDTSINSEAPVVVMTTEVLRNMLYADSNTLAGLAYVVMDEVHYLADRFRGAVWEEVIIHLPSEVSVISLSATVSNAEEFGAWLGTVRGDTAVVVSEHRPVPLWQHVMVRQDLVDLFVENVAFDKVAEAAGKSGHKTPAINPELLKLARTESVTTGRGSSYGRRGGGARGRRYQDFSAQDGAGQNRGGQDRGGQDRGGHAHEIRSSARAASRPQVIRALERQDLLPAITFIFSRAACDAAVQQCAAAGLWLTTEAEREEIARRVDTACAELPDADRDILGFWGWRDGLLRGLAAHHAGMLPSFKEVVEDLFVHGLVRAVFATETLALGINMPARTVVLEKLEKFNGEAHVGITAGEYTQLTGRAGRRGIDVEGHAVVLWKPGTDPAAVGGLASKRSYPLNSSFRPTYNMSINLVAQFGRARTRQILESSFAQFQADRSVVDLARQVRSREESLAGYEKSMTCHLGDFNEYAKLRRELSDHESGASKTKAKQRREAVLDSVASLRAGDVIMVTEGRNQGYAVVVQADSSSRQPRPGVVGMDREYRRLGAQELSNPVEPVARVRVPKGFNAKVPKDKRHLLAAVQDKLENIAGLRPHRSAAFAYQDSTAVEDEAIAALRRKLRAHPCHGCSEREDHARWSERWWKLRRETDGIVRAIQARTNTIARTFDRVIDLLAGYGFVVANGSGELRPSDDGQRLRRVYGEKDLLIALALRQGSFADLDAAELASFTTALVYQSKRDAEGARPRMPSVGLEQAVEDVVVLWAKLQDAEESHKLPLTSEPELGLMWPMYKWAKGRSLQESLNGTELAAGDFVRWSKQVIDLLGQLSQVPALPAGFAKTCHSAMDLVRRGVVAYGAVVA
ncbi:DEAD/DEAH box helicase [Arthrobacter sp. H35-D1]|uniref:DEAD/DEAH box helicase n=1 Tax=Arthrobacter sp. H35-D1 TaxID=3046202 RepID=UPI0024B9791C|nr:DEAD/DEAH box helicase [Arthrobacter sp. H35-D1]MDJ0314738.1 DEAD/DEAH box helicase [Arthrobacter sp. H35-D1]